MVEIPDVWTADPGAEYKNLGSIGTRRYGQTNSGRKVIDHITTAGIPVYNLYPFSQLNQSSAVTTTVMGAGYLPRQQILIMGNSDSNTLTFSEGGNMELNGGNDVVMGLGDFVEFIWDDANNKWWMRGPKSDN